jgi:hypothetical protein
MTKSKQEKIVPPDPITDLKSERLIWFERARAINEYSTALKQADAKALGLFELMAEQMQRQLELSANLHRMVIGIALVILIISLVTLLTAPDQSLLQRFGVFGTPASLIVLLVVLFRSPVIHQRHLLNSTLKLNVIFMSFVRRVKQSDLVLQYLYYENDPLELTKIFALIQDFQNGVEQTMEEIEQIDTH